MSSLGNFPLSSGLAFENVSVNKLEINRSITHVNLLLSRIELKRKPTQVKEYKLIKECEKITWLCSKRSQQRLCTALHTCINKRPALKIVVAVLPKLIAGTGSTVYTSVYICIYTNIYNTYIFM